MKYTRTFSSSTLPTKGRKLKYRKSPSGRRPDSLRHPSTYSDFKLRIPKTQHTALGSHTLPKSARLWATHTRTTRYMGRSAVILPTQ